MKSEAEFKAEQCATWRKIGKYQKVFFIETEETEKGFPDVLALDCCGADSFLSYLYEFKVSDEKGMIKFRRDQPRFYLKNKELVIFVIAFDNRDGTVHTFRVSELFNDGKHKINEKQEVYL